MEGVGWRVLDGGCWMEGIGWRVWCVRTVWGHTTVPGLLTSPTSVLPPVQARPRYSDVRYKAVQSSAGRSSSQITFQSF